jgi:hypothetical protein
MVIDALVHLKKPTFTYNHSLIEHDGYVWEAIAGGVRQWTVQEHYAQDKYRKPYQTKEIELDLNGIELNKAIGYLNKQVGKKYEFANFLFHILNTFVEWRGSVTDRKLYCYELIIRTMNFTKKWNLDIFLNPREFNELF